MASPTSPASSPSRLPKDVLAADVLAATSPEHGAALPAPVPATTTPTKQPVALSNAASITETLRAEIFAGTYPLGSQLPAEEALCDRFNVSRGPVRQATANLREEGLISSGRGRNSHIVRATPGTSVATLINHMYLPVGTTPELTEVTSDIDQATGRTRLTAVYLHYDASGAQIAREDVEATLHLGANISKHAGATELIEAVTEGIYMPHHIASRGFVEAIDVECAVVSPTGNDTVSEEPETEIVATATTHRGEVAFLSTTRVYVPMRIGARVVAGHTSSLQLHT